MRKWKIYYYAEQNDECVDLEIIIEAENVRKVIELFEQEVSVYKRVYKIEEI